MTSSTRSIVSDGLGLIQYPVGTCESSDLGDHIMGVVTLAWCSDDALDRWGETWARHGSVAMRFQSHLTAGLELTIEAAHHAHRSELAVTGAGGTRYATGTIRSGPTTPLDLPPRTRGAPFPVPPRAELLDGYELHPVEFDFSAARDLALVERLAHGDFWRSRAWAHPAWLASAANALVRHNVNFEDGGYWLHAGVEVTVHYPVPDGAALVARGRVSELFDRATHRFMVGEVVIMGDGGPAASIRTTSVYGAAEA